MVNILYIRMYVCTNAHTVRRCVQGHVVHSGLCVWGGGGGRGVEFTTMGRAVLTRDVPASVQ